VNNAVSRVAGLFAVALFGVLMLSRFDRDMQPRIERLGLSAAARAALSRELPKMAGADLDAVDGLSVSDRRRAQEAINESFVSAFRTVMLDAAGLAAISAGAGAVIP